MPVQVQAAMGPTGEFSWQRWSEFIAFSSAFQRESLTDPRSRFTAWTGILSLLVYVCPLQIKSVVIIAAFLSYLQPWLKNSCE